MNIRIQIIIVLLVLVGTVAILRMIHKKQLQLKYALPWMAMAAGIFIFTIVPGLTSRVSEIMGVGIPVNMLFFLGFCFSLAIIFILTVLVSGLSHKMKKLTQELGLIRKELDDLKRKE